MPENAVLQTILSRASVRRWEDRDVPDEVLETIVRAGRQAPFTGQSYSVIVTRDRAKREELSKVFGRMCLAASIFMLICRDFRKLEKFIAAKGRTNRMEDLGLLLFSTQDAAYFGENMALAAESLGLGTVFLGSAPFVADRLIPMFSDNLAKQGIHVE